ncbi:MAG: argininosuccinate lyase [Lachnospiraceae bacterium]|nr:argininosuccinate lyase [Lachnospiraceae bacterium]
MAQLWGGRFRKETDDLVYAFNASLSFDKRLFEQDVRGSIAHAAMLTEQGILTREDGERIMEGLEGILKDAESGALVVGGDAEDIHSFVEAELTARIGDAGKRLHTGRSRNDQVALDMRLYMRDEADETVELLGGLLRVIFDIMERERDTYMPGFTHLQKAQPVTVGHHFGAYFEMFRRDLERLLSIRERMNVCPLGSGALAGTTYPLDRDFTASLLGFDRPCENSMDGVSDRDYVIEMLDSFAITMMHLSRLSEEIIIWNSNEYRFIELDDTYATGSSIMPQKKNPDIAELIRGKTGRVYGALHSMLVTMKGIPLAYDKDMQEDKELTFDAVDTTKGCIRLMTGMLATSVFNAPRMEESACGGFANATDAADYLVRKGVPFRDAHGVIGRIVLTCIERGIRMDDLPLEDYRAECPEFDSDIYEAISLKACVERRTTKGAPGDMGREIENARAFLEETGALSAEEADDGTEYWFEKK